MQRKFAIVTDTGSDLPEEYYREHEIDCVRLGFTMDAVTYGGEDGASIDDKVFYARLREGAMPTTFQVSPEQARLHIEAHAKEGRDVLVISFSSGLSGTYQNYVMAAKEVMKAYPGRKALVIDSLCASLGQGLFVDYLVRKADTGAEIEEVYGYGEALRLHICHYFTVDNLYHLKRGGRISGTTALLGTILNIKPVLHVDKEGHLVAVGKTMGRKKSIMALVTHMKELQTLQKDDPIYVSHGDCGGDAEYLISLLKENFTGHEIVVNMIGSVIGTHSGAGTLAVFFRGKQR